MSTTPLSVAVIGAGMAGTTHANAWRQVGTVFDLGLPPVRLHTIADAYLPFAEDAAQRYGYEHAVDDWRTVAEDQDIDIVSIVVGNALHREDRRGPHQGRQARPVREAPGGHTRECPCHGPG